MHDSHLNDNEGVTFNKAREAGAVPWTLPRKRFAS